MTRSSIGGPRRLAGLRRLTWRLLRGADARDRVRVGLQVVAVGLAVLTGLLVATMPLIFGAQHQRIADRYPLYAADDSAAPVHVGMTDELYRGTVLSIWLVSSDGAHPPLPPGLTDLPAPGHMALSPRLHQAWLEDPALRMRLPGVVDGEIGPQGLASPSELFAWVGTDRAAAPVASFGAPLSAVSGLWVGGGGTIQAVELAILVGLPLLGFLAAASRMAVGTRMAHLSTLRLLGLSTPECAGLYGGQLAAIAGLGSLLGCLAYQPLSDLLGRTGIIGVSWNLGDTRVWWPILVGLVAVMVGLGGSLGRSAVRRALSAPVRQAERAPLARWAVRALAVIAAGQIAYLALMWRWYGASRTWHPNSRQFAILLMWVVASLIVLLIVSQLADWLGTSLDGWPVLALGCRLSRSSPSGAGAALATMGVMILVTGLSAIAATLGLAAASGTDQPIAVEVSARSVDATGAARLVDLARSGRYTGYAHLAASLADDPSGAGITVVVGDCAMIVATFGSAMGCPNGPVVLTGSAPAVLPGTAVSIDLVDGTQARAVVPSDVLRSSAFPEAILIPFDQAPWLASAAPSYSFYVSQTGNEYDTLLAAITQATPAAEISTGWGDPVGRQNYLQQQALLRVFTATGFLFCALTLVLAGASMGQDQLRSLTALQQVGLRRRQLRLAMALGRILPVAVATSAIALVVGVGSQAQLAVSGLGASIHASLWMQVAGSALVGIVLAGAVGAATVAKLDLSRVDARE